jgi:ABC-type dipeptide/oligopeptide/nickel transport system ATPase component
MKIKNLHINNFKFFPKSQPIKLDQKHLLVYGENGSGKSSIYWALYTLLDSSIKELPAEIKKYFKRNNRDCLVNIYAKNNKTSFVQIELEDGSKYRIAHDDDKILTDGPTNQRALAINLASDFINYRMLYRFHDLKHSKDFEIFNFFEGELMMYLDIGGVRAKRYWKELLLGPTKVFNAAREEVYPTAADAPLTPEYKAFKLKVGRFNRWLKNLLDRVEQVANDYIKDDFEIDLKIKFAFQPATLAITPDKPTINYPKITIEVPEYYGTRNQIKKPHTFLNEAKLTAIGLAIRLGILKQRLGAADLKTLIMDDLLISLDMSYRDKVLDIIIEKLAVDYQLILLTHDYNFFEVTKDKIAKYNRTLIAAGHASVEWKKLEMYEYKRGKKLFPLVTNSKTNLEKAKKYFYQKAIDLPASANYMRKAAEHFCDEFLPLAAKHNANFTKLDLSALINKTPAEATRRGMALPLFTKLDSLRMFILNPQSHYNTHTPPLFKTDMQKAIKTLDKLEKLTGITL